jgi:hypothetical protein
MCIGTLMKLNPVEIIPRAQLALIMFQRSPGGHQFVLKARPGCEGEPGLASLDQKLAAQPGLVVDSSLVGCGAKLVFHNRIDAQIFHDYLNENAVRQYIDPRGFGPEPVRGPNDVLVFVCHASEDKAAAEGIAKALNAVGIATFIDTDDIKADASFVSRINEALRECTHFIALLSPYSSDKKWPKHEVDSITSRVIGKEVSFLPIALSDYSVKDFRRNFMTLAHIPLRTCDCNSDLIPQLVSNILGLSRKSPLGELPEIAKKPINHELSPAAFAVVEWMCKGSSRGHDGDPACEIEVLQEDVGLTSSDLEDAIDDLGPLIRTQELTGYHGIASREALFARYDHLFMDWNPERDARVIGAVLVAGGLQVVDTKELADELGFLPRRMNPAIAWLLERGLLKRRDYAAGDYDFIQFRLYPTKSLRRFAN